ncbi:hypothetical protein SAMN05444273_10624 [Litoreibacter ascidiaceicola]|uniref:Uncharacterized protein n=1 Tax=Litoreibacter ascidiaceicola TaxID=1486859 RepID=A0A1M5BKV8_9RHOB|nr:hypothetical protein [Litoreibacter ascidiaceicola]SHF43076.1 hypothetical protein SAMN05444273_10624 [Litoreibacter ascidiaceicola]
MERAAVAHFGQERGPARKAIDDLIEEQARQLAAAMEMVLAISERDMVVINRPCRRPDRAVNAKKVPRGEPFGG